MARTRVFISYSHKDHDWVARLQKQLKPLERRGLIDAWADTRLEAGDEWHAAIREAIASARIAILIVSADFLASDFIAAEELPALLARAKSEGATIIPRGQRSPPRRKPVGHQAS